MHDFLSNIHIWMLFAFLAFFLLFFKKLKTLILNFLNNKIATIETDIKQSEDTLNSALKLLNTVKSQNTEKKHKNSTLILKAQNNADLEYEKAFNTLNAQMKTSIESLENYLEATKNKFLTQVNNTIITNSTNEVVELINKNLNEQNHKDLIDKSIDNLNSFLKR